MAGSFKYPRSGGTLTEEVLHKSRGVLESLLSKQKAVANDFYKRQNSPHLADTLGPSLLTVQGGGDRLDFTINYPKTIRFLDMKKSRKGKLKIHYKPIYNRLLFGHFYGKDYSITKILSLKMADDLKDFIKQFKKFLEEQDNKTPNTQ